MTAQMEAQLVQLQTCMYQYSRAIYRSIKDLIDPYAEPQTQLESRRAVLEQCEQTMERLAADPHYFAKPDRALFQDIRRFFPITAQAQVAWAVKEGVGAAVGFIEEQLEAGALDGGVARCRATTRKGKPCQRTPLPERDYCPSHQHLERRSPRPRHFPKPISSAADVARHRQADPAALAGRLPDGGAAAADRARRQGQRRGLLGDVGRGVRAALLLRPRRADRARRAAPLAARRVHRRGALHAPLRELLPRRARARRRRARGAPDGALHARGHVRLRRAAAARAAEPRARPPRLRRRADRDGRERPGARSRLLARDGRPPVQARVGDLEAADDQVQLLVAAPRPDARADAQPLRAAARPRHLVRRRPRSRQRRRPHVPRLADPQRHPLRDPPRARLPAARRLRRRRVPGRRGLAARPRRRHGADRGHRRHGVVGAPDAARGRDARGRRLRDRVRVDRAARGLGAAPERPRRAARAGGAARRRAPRGCERVREAHEGEPPKLAREKTVARRRRTASTARAARRARALRRPAGAPRVPARRVRRGPRRRARRRRARRALPHPARGAPGAPLAAQPRQLRRRLLHGLRRARRRRRAGRQGAVRRRLPARAAPDAARGARDPARARHRRPDDRGAGAHAARPRAQEARGDVRPVRGPPDARAARRSATRRSSSRRSRAGSRSAASSRSTT